MNIQNISRRGFLKAGAAGSAGLVLTTSLVTVSSHMFSPALAQGEAAEISMWVKIMPDGMIEMLAVAPEIGQGARSGIPLLIADEMEADWGRVRLVQAPGGAEYGYQNVSGSASVRENWSNLRQVGASARLMLERAAAEMWGVSADQCQARLHEVHGPDGQKAGYGELAEAAAQQSLPDEADLRLKDKSEFRYIGKATDTYDAPDIVQGKAIYSMDVTVPGMKYAAVVRPPVVGGRVKSFNDAAALAVDGVERVFELSDPVEPPNYYPLGGVAVVANSTYAARKGADALEIEWDNGPNTDFDSEEEEQQLLNLSRNPGTQYYSKGDVAAKLAAAESVISAEYFIQYSSHMQMEPLVAVADVRADSAEFWMPSQGPIEHKQFLAGLLRLSPENVTLNVILTGGGFGRKGKCDFAAEAALISREIGAPVKLTWSREDDVRHGYYHGACVQHMEASLGQNGLPEALLHRCAFPTLMSTFDANETEAYAFEMEMGATNSPLNIPNMRVEWCPTEARMRIGWLRSVGNINHAFSLGSFVDELAYKAGRDPAEYLLDVLGPDRHVDPAAEGGTEYANHGRTLEEYPVDTSRLAAVIRQVVEDSGWKDKRTYGRHLGIAAHRSFLTYVATVVEVEVNDDGTWYVPDAYYAVDLGQPVNLDRIRAQIEGGAIFALSMALGAKITVSGGAVNETNFGDCTVARIGDAPTVHVSIMENNHPPSGIGEPPVPPFAPALANALFSATGKRFRRLPIGPNINDA